MVAKFVAMPTKVLSKDQPMHLAPAILYRHLRLSRASTQKVPGPMTMTLSGGEINTGLYTKSRRFSG